MNLVRAMREMRNAMPRVGSVRISTWSRENEVVICIRDDQPKSRLKVSAPNWMFDPYQFPPGGAPRRQLGPRDDGDGGWRLSYCGLQDSTAKISG